MDSPTLQAPQALPTPLTTAKAGKTDARTPIKHQPHQANRRIHAPATPASPLAYPTRRRREPSTLPSNPHDPDVAAVASLASLASPSHQQEQGSAAYLARLLRLSQCRPSRPQHPKPAMADFLAGFDLGAQSPAQSNNLSCDSVQDVQIHLRGVLDAKATPNRAEHVSITMELRSAVRFTLVLSEPENDVLEGLAHIDPSLGGSRSTSIPIDQTGGQLSRVVEANETLMNQPQDNPALQRSVAKHIITAVSATDGSTWNVREVSRGAHGWTFTYLCKDSYQQWSRQNAKNPMKAIVGEYSQREPDPKLFSRPAFDCRGSVAIAFNRNSRSITVKYDHTPIHKTVAQLAEYFKPPPRELGPGAQRVLQQKTPKAPKTPRKPKEKKNHRESTRAQDENVNPRKRKKKNDGAAQPVPPYGLVMPPDYPGAAPVNGQAQAGPSYTTGVDSTVDSGQNPQGFNDYPQGLMGAEPTVNGSQQHQADSQPPGVSLPVNISATEAARRKQVAITILFNVGVDPKTLSTEQFKIFSNQSPDLQKESLGMLVKYGAERLQIVHPSNREGSASAIPSTSAVSAQSSQSTPSGPRTTKELVPQSSARSTQNWASTANSEDATQNSTQTPGRSKRGMGKSRTACFSCKSRKIKCLRERPSCTECQIAGMTCEYAPQKSRYKKKTKLDAIMVGDDEEDEEAPEEDTEVDLSHLQSGEQHDVLDYSSYNNMPVANMLTPSVEQPVQEHPQSGCFQPASGLALPQVPISRSVSHQAHNSSGLGLSQDQNYGSETSQPVQPTEQQPAPTQAKSVSPQQQRKRAPRGSTVESRRSVASGPNRADDQAMPMNPQSASDWPAVSNPTMPSITTVSPQMSHSTTTKLQTRQSGRRMSVDSNHIRIGMQQAAALSQAALHQQSHQPDHTQSRENMQQATTMAQTVMQPHQSPTVVAAVQAVHRTSPFQQTEAPYTKSRQSQSAQSRTPVANQSMTGGLQPPPSQQISTDSAGQQSSVIGGMPGYNDYGRYSTSSTTSHQSSQTPSYDSYSHQQPASTSTSSRQTDSSSRNAAIAMSMSSQPPSTIATSYPSSVSASNQWSRSQSRNTRSYDNNTSSHNTRSSYSQQPSTSTSSSASLQNFSMRDNTARQQQHQQQLPAPSTRSGDSFNQQQQPQSYSSHPAQSTNQESGQPANQHQNWNYFSGSNNTSFTPANQPSGYSWKMPDESWSGV
ncbi:Fc.00g087030.m01.CDS01 [Cosmosporella sp. VM-42]